MIALRVLMREPGDAYEWREDEIPAYRNGEVLLGGTDYDWGLKPKRYRTLWERAGR